MSTVDSAAALKQGLVKHSGARISVVIPAYNEAENLPHVLPQIPNYVYEVILVDDHSTDDTTAVARELLPTISIIKTQRGRGKGAALQTGFAAASGDIVVTFDADGSSNPLEIPAFVGPLLAGADYAKGSRFMQGGGTADMPWHRIVGNAFFVMLVRLLYGGRYTDLCYGYNAFWLRVAPQLRLDGDGFEIETMMNIRVLQHRLRVVEVPSFEAARVCGVGYLQTFPDGWRVLKTIWRERQSATPKHLKRQRATGQRPIPYVSVSKAHAEAPITHARPPTALDQTSTEMSARSAPAPHAEQASRR